LVGVREQNGGGPTKCGYEYEHKDENQPLPNCPDEGIYTIWNPVRLKPRFVESI
jgi:hypothetical protein